MKQTKLSIFSIALAMGLLFAAVFVACTKNKAINTVEDVAGIQEATQGDGEADALYGEVYDNVMGYNGDGIGVGAGVGIFGQANIGDGTSDPNTARTDSLPSCVTITVSPLAPGAFPKTVTINFGTVGCPGPDGRIRRGKIITVYSNRMMVPGATATTTFDAHYIDSNKIEGTHIVTNQSSALTPQFNVKVVDGKISRPSGQYIKRNVDRTIKQIDGVGTIGFPLDDKFEVLGTARGERFNGTTTNGWSSVITEGLIKRFTCRWFLTGKVTITRPSGATANLDYAPINSGTCDNKASITSGGTTVIITLP
jgi:hypothetical protein